DKQSLKIDDIEFELAKLVTTPPQGDQWVHEIKFDGYRTLCHLANGKCHFYTRSQLDWTTKYDFLTRELSKIKADSAWLDGEIVSLDSEGRSNFGLLQEDLKSNRQSNLVYYIFDLLELDGEDIRSLPLLERK